MNMNTCSYNYKKTLIGDLVCYICFVIEHVMQDSTTITVKDTQPTIVLVTHTLMVVDGGGGADVVAQCKYK